MVGHKGGISAISVGKDCIFSGSYDSNVFLWNKNCIQQRIEMREVMQLEELYSMKLDAYNSHFSKAKGKKSKKGKKNKKEKAKEKKEQELAQSTPMPNLLSNDLGLGGKNVIAESNIV